MKRIVLAVVCAILAWTVVACGSTNAASQDSQSRGQPVDDGSIRGIVTAVSDTQIEIAKMDNGGRGGNGNPPSGQPSGGDQQNPPSGPPSGNPPAAPSGSQQPQASFDTSNMEKAQYTIDKNTQIVKREFQGNGQGNGQNQQANATETAASISDIQQGTMVSITVQSGNDKAAAKIVITEGFGQRGNAPSSTPAASASAS